MQVAAFKKVLLRNIEPEDEGDATGEIRIDLFKEGLRIAFINIAVEGYKEHKASFNNNEIHFGFRMTYAMGMFLDNIR